MAATSPKILCASCRKAAGIAMCNGCQQSFCLSHFAKHREELSEKVDHAIQEHDLLRQALGDRTRTASFFTQVDQWEEESIQQIQAAAATARNDLQRLVDRAKNDLERHLGKLAEEIQRCRNSDDYAEMDIQHWSNRLTELRQTLERPPMIKSDFDSKSKSVIRLITISDLQNSSSSGDESNPTMDQSRTTEQSLPAVNERFSESFGDTQICYDRLTVVCQNDREDGSCVAGRSRYSFGKHQIRFGIVEKKSDYFFFGILTASQELQPNISTVSNAYGWWDLDLSVVHGKPNAANFEKIFRRGDELVFTFDCDHRELQLEHCRTRRIATVSIDLNQCPFPWKFVLRLDSIGDCVTIIP